MSDTPVACSLRVTASPLKGASPAAWQSQFRSDRLAGGSGQRRIVDMVLHRVQRALRARVRYRYVRPRVLREWDGESEAWRVECPCCSRNIDKSGGVIDIALLRRDRQGHWELLARDHVAKAWTLQHQAARLDSLLALLCADEQRVFWP